jgi:peptidoglycan hydrolase-like protein with peptidoglycan-binding domain
MTATASGPVIAVDPGNPERKILTQKLYLGIKSPEVTILQQFLIKEGYLKGSADGSFGPMTHSAVRRFQLALGLDVDGRVGPNTRSLINKLIVQ